nr:asparaginase [Cellulomonas composti]
MEGPDVGATAVPLARVLRGDLVESVHAGHLVVLAPDGSLRLALGDPFATFWARSSLKPLQAVGMLRQGLDVDDEALALVCASHNGEPRHLAVVRRILADAGLTEADLDNTPDRPLDADAAWQWRADGHGPASLTQNCSGKHAGMLATCVAAGWPTGGYRDAQHPLQVALRGVVGELTGEHVTHVTVDGCGAPLFSTSLVGLARAFGRIAQDDGSDEGAGTGLGDGRPSAAAGPPATPERRVARAMSTHPWLVAGTGRDATAFMTALPGLVAKDGAESVYAAGLPDGGAVALKIADGSARPRAVVLAAALAVAGVDPAVVGPVGATPVLGHGEPVGAVVATFGG